jgi:3-oxoadipate enol-lactonase
VAAVELDYIIEGEGPPLYMAHGIGSRKSAWRAITDALANDFTCVAYDQRGHGESPIPPVPYSLDNLVEDLEALRQKLGHDKIHVMGHSLGGQIGPAFARTHPDHTLSIVLLSTAAARTVEDCAKVNGVVAKMRAEGVAPILPTLVARWYTDEFCAARPDAIQDRIAQVNGTPEDVFLSVFDVYASTEMASWLPQVTAPCLVLTGENDPGCNPRLNTEIDRLLPNSELVILPELRHSILVEGPDQVIPPVRDFLLRHKDG